MTTRTSRRAGKALLALVFVSFATTGCLLRSEEGDGDVELPGTLSVGEMLLLDFPYGSEGISSLSPDCRRLFDCGCPILSPEDVAFCREEVGAYTDEDCRSILYTAVPECLPD